MTKGFASKLESLADDLRAQADDLRVDNFLSFIYTADLVNRYLNIALRKYNLNRTQMSILHFLITHGGTLTPTELSRRVFRSKHAVTKAVDGLEQEGLVQREGATMKDRRLRKVSITRKGLDIVKNTMPVRQEISSRAMSCLSEAQAMAFTTTLKQLRRHIRNLL